MFREYSTNVYFINNQTYSLNSLAVKYSKMSSRKRIAVPLKEKKRYAEMIMKGASRSTISDLYRKKYKSELPETTFFRWKREAKSLVEVKSNHRCVQSWKKSNSMEKFEEKIKKEYVKRQIKLKKRGLTSFVRQVQTNFSVRIKFFSKILHIIGKFTDNSFSQFSSKTAYNWTAYKLNTTVNELKSWKNIFFLFDGAFASD